MSTSPNAGFAGARVAVLEARLGSQVEALVRRLGGEPVWAPALREEPVAAGPEVAAAVDRLCDGARHVVVLQTGAGVDAFFDEAERLGRTTELSAALQKAVTVSRGPKPAAALARRGLKPSVGVASPFTTHELLMALEGLTLSDAAVTLVHYGERNEVLRRSIEARAARLYELLLYEWRLPEDVGPLRHLVEELVAGRIDVVAFTSQVQIRHLFAVAGSERRSVVAAALGAALVGAIGPTCAAAATEFGFPVAIVPENPKLGPLFNALVSAFAARLASKESSR